MHILKKFPIRGCLNEKISVSLSFFLLFVSNAACAWLQADRISEIKVIHGNQTVVKFKGATWHGCSGTQQNPNPYFLISEGNQVSDQRKQMLSIALAALAADKEVWIVTGTSEGDSPGCSSNGLEWVYSLSIRAGS